MTAPRSERLTFPNPEGQRLSARLELPATGSPRAFALFAHCFTCSKDLFAASRIGRALAERGLAVLRFDFTGLGESEGEFADTNFSSNVDDLAAAADFLRTHYQAPRVLIGHSLGGAAVLAAAGRIPEAAAVVTIGAPAEPGHLRRRLGPAAVEAIEHAGEAEVTLGGRTLRVRKQFLDDIAGPKLMDAVAGLRKALLVLHAPGDEVVAIDNAAAIYAAARHPKSFVSLDDADHLLTRREDAAYVAEVTATWLGRYLPAAPEGEEPEPETGLVRVAETGEGTFTQEVRVGRHLLRADEPTAVGGLDTGPNPYDLLLAALGACTTMTLRIYARHKSLPLKRAAVTLRHEKIHARDCEECETKEGRIDRVERVIELEGDLDGAQRRRMLEIADRCPVHRTLTSEVVIRTRLADHPAG